MEDGLRNKELVTITKYETMNLYQNTGSDLPLVNRNYKIDIRCGNTFYIYAYNHKEKERK